MGCLGPILKAASTAKKRTTMDGITMQQKTINEEFLSCMINSATRSGLPGFLGTDIPKREKYTK
jgi:hypothetical protein